jgi:hypothetical protein
MSRGGSGRIVIEVDPELKRRLYAVLAMSGSTLKDWFVASASKYCDHAVQSDLFPENGLPGTKEKRGGP